MEYIEKKLKWWQPPVKAEQTGCLCCPSTEQKLSMFTRMFNGFGGWKIIKDGEVFYRGDPTLDHFEDYPTLMKFENMARKEPYSEWIAELYLPLRSAKYQRHGKNKWILIETGNGFA